MSYTYLPRGSPFDGSAHAHPTIIMTTNPSSRKALNLLSNPRVSLLVHDWVSHRPPTLADTNPDIDENNDPSGRGNGETETGGAADADADADREGSPPPAATRSSLASLLLSLNTSALSSISTTIMGDARVVEQGAEEERWCKERHRENNTFAAEEVDQSNLQQQEEREQGQRHQGGGGGGVEDEDEDVRVVAVRVKEGRIADWKGGVRDWVVAADGEQQQGSNLPNGIPGS